MRIMADCLQILQIVSFVFAVLAVIFMAVTYVLPIKKERKAFTFRCAAWASVTNVVITLLYVVVCWFTFCRDYSR